MKSKQQNARARKAPGDYFNLNCSFYRWRNRKLGKYEDHSSSGKETVSFLIAVHPSFQYPRQTFPALVFLLLYAALLCLMVLCDQLLYFNNPDPFAWMKNFVLIFSFIHQNAKESPYWTITYPKMLLLSFMFSCSRREKTLLNYNESVCNIFHSFTIARNVSLMIGIST